MHKPEFVTRIIEDDIGRTAPVQPAWLGIPDSVRVSGLGRSLIYQEIKSGRIRSVVVRKPHCQKGRRLVNLNSLLAFIESFDHNGKEHSNGAT